jgi:prepilin-type N-terminal cleavage/methylation domain-containing protein
MTKNNSNLRAFSLIELSITILIIGILIAGITSASRLVRTSKISKAQALTKSSPISSITGLTMWLETTSEASFRGTFNDNETISGISGTEVWFDINPLSNIKYHAKSAGANPNYSIKGINDLPALYFNGTSQYLRLDPNILINTEYTVIVVESPTRAATSSPAYFIGSDGPCSGSDCFTFGYATAAIPTVRFGHWSYDLDNDGYSLGSLSSYNLKKPSIHIGITSKAGKSYHKDGVTGASSGQNILLATNSSMNVAKSLTNYYQGFIGEIIVFNKALNAEERRVVETYLSKKWDIPVNQPNNPLSPTQYSSCFSANENGSLVMTAPAGKTWTGVSFASYGTPNSCVTSGCHASSSLTVVQNACVGQTTCTVGATNGAFGDPCVGTGKRLQVILTY